MCKFPHSLDWVLPTLADNNIIRIVDQPKDVLQSLVLYTAVLFAVISATNCFITGTTRVSKITVSHGRITRMQPSILFTCFTLVACFAGTNAVCTFNKTLGNIELDGLTKPMIDGKIDLFGDGWGDSITGWNGTEYTGFLKLPMHEAGNTVKPQVGDAFIGYDCSKTLLCVAAYLQIENFTTGNNVDVSQTDTYVEFGSPPMNKLFPGAKFAFVKYTGGVNCTDPNDPRIGK